MRKITIACAAIAALALVIVNGAFAASAADVQLWRLDCGQIRVDDLNSFSDTYAYVGQSRVLAASCYLIRHGDDYMLWDAGLPKSDQGLPLNGAGSTGQTLGKTLVEQLAALKLSAERIGLIGISHYHFDHTGQAGDFPQARLLLGRGDVRALREPDNAARAKPLAHWLTGDGKLEEVSGDKDVFGDGTVMVIRTPGHTPGHMSVLVRLRSGKNYLVTGDAAHFHENWDTNGVPGFNFDRAQTLASMDRLKKIAANLGATVVIQHDPRDVGKLPAWPAAAR